jgi:hypothetical protein
MSLLEATWSYIQWLLERRAVNMWSLLSLLLLTATAANCSSIMGECKDAE